MKKNHNIFTFTFLLCAVRYSAPIDSIIAGWCQKFEYHGYYARDALPSSAHPSMIPVTARIATLLSGVYLDITRKYR